MSYKQSDYVSGSTRGDFTLQNDKAKQHSINSGERLLMAIAITILLLIYQISFSQPTGLKQDSDSLQVETQSQSLVE